MSHVYTQIVMLPLNTVPQIKQQCSFRRLSWFIHLLSYNWHEFQQWYWRTVVLKETSWLVLLILNLALHAMVGLRATQVSLDSHTTQRKRWRSLKRSLIPMQLFPHSKSLYVFFFFFLLYFFLFNACLLVSLSVSSFQSYIGRTQKNPIIAQFSVPKLSSLLQNIVILVCEFPIP